MVIFVSKSKQQELVGSRKVFIPARIPSCIFLPIALNKLCAYVFVQPDAARLDEIAALIDKGRVRPEISQVFTLREADKAHIASQSGLYQGQNCTRRDEVIGKGRAHLHSDNSFLRWSV